MRKKTEIRWAVWAAIASLCLALTACGGNTASPEEKHQAVETSKEEHSEEETAEEWAATESEEAKNMLLNRKEGTLGIIETGTALSEGEIYEGMKLISGDQLNTEADSYAWIDLDDSKELKMDQKSETMLSKEGKNLAITLTKGNLFFHVAEHLAEDENLQIDTTTMNMAIRGTTGIVEQVSDKETAILLLEGSLEIEAGYSTVSLEAGQFAHLVGMGNGNVACYIRNIYEEDIPAFAADQIDGRSDIQDKIVANGGNPSPEANPFLPYIRNIVENRKLPNGKTLEEIDGKGGGGGLDYLSVADVNGDGEDEFLVRWGEQEGMVYYEALYTYDAANDRLNEELLDENAELADFWRMPGTENTVDRFCNLADYAEKYVLKDGIYVNKGVSLKNFFVTDSLTYTCPWEYTSEDGNKEDFFTREYEFPIDENTNFVVDGKSFGNDIDAFNWESPDYWDANHMTITVKNGVCSEVSIRW